MNRLLIGMVVVVALPLAALGSARAAAPRAASGATSAQTLVIAYHQPPSDLDPATSYDGPAATILRGEYEGLVRLKGKSTMQLEGALASSWSTTKNKVW